MSDNYELHDLKLIFKDSIWGFSTQKLSATNFYLNVVMLGIIYVFSGEILL